MVKNQEQLQSCRSLDFREKAVLIISTLCVLYRIYMSPRSEENTRNALALGLLTLLTTVIGEPEIPLTLTRCGSSGLFYGLVLGPAVCLGISERHDENSNSSEITQALADEQVKVSAWLALLLYLPRMKFKSVIGQSMQSLAVFVISILIMQYVFHFWITIPVLIHVFSSIFISKLIHSYLPYCFTCGELFLVLKLFLCLLLNYPSLTSAIQVCLVGNYVLASVLFFVLGLIPLLLFGILSPWLFYSSGMILLLGLLCKLSESLHQSFPIWTLDFLQSNWPIRTGLLVLWVAEILACALYVAICRTLSKKSNTTERKIFHLVVLVTFIPGIYLDMGLIFICSIGAMCLLLLLEVMRALEMPPLAKLLNDRFRVFTDSQDSGLLILTPIYLLLGQSLPIWLVCLQQPALLRLNKPPSLPPAIFSGILSVAVGDTAASVIGFKYGKTKWAGSKKTVEGTIAAIASQIIAALLLCNATISICHISAIITVSLVEAYTSQIDNLILPIFMYLLLNSS